jgi:hypothetical protein
LYALACGEADDELESELAEKTSARVAVARKARCFLKVIANFSLANLELAVQPDIFGARANHHFEFARLDDETHLAIQYGEIVALQNKLDCLRLAGAQMDAFEAAQILFVRRNTGYKFVNVELHDLVAAARSGVRYIAGDRNVD